jgi:hypothetical protein
VLAVRRTFSGIVLFLSVANLAALDREVKPTISVTFAINGETVPCDNLKVELRIDHRPIPVKMIEHGFIVPEVFNKLYSSPRSRRKDNIDIRITCGEYSFEFPGEYPAQLLPGEWKLGIRYPQTWFEGRREEPSLEKGTWLSIIDWECNECDPVVESTIPHSDPPVAVVDRLRREQPDARGEKAMDTAYALAVFNTEYQKNRAYLLSLLDICLSKPNESPLDGICNDTKLSMYLENLYWRGDSKLLGKLLESADSPAYVVEENGYFYGDMLDRRTTLFIQSLSALPDEKQKAACMLAGKDDLSVNSPKEKRVATQLRAIGGDVANRCLQEVEKTETWWNNRK